MKPGLSGGLSLPACAALAALAGAGAFANSIGNDFAYDDRLIVLGNESIQQLETLPGTFLEPYWPNRHGREMGLWRPVATWLYGLQWALWGGDPTGFHVVNVVLNSLCAALVVLLLGQLLPTPAAVVGGILFAVHPVHSEVVANVVGMAELLSAGLYLGACLVVVRSGKRMGPVALMVVGALFLLACLVKESAVTLPGTVLLLDAARRTIRLGDVKAYLRERWPLYAVLALVMTGLCLGRIAVLGSIANAFPPMGAEILADGEVPRIWTVLATWPEVLRLLLFPLDLSIDYTPEVVPVAYGWTARSALGLFIGLAVLVVAWGTWRAGRLSTVVLSPRALGFGILWFVVTVLPVSNLFFLTGVLLAERTLFLPSVGLAAGAGWMLVQLRRERPRIGTAVTIAAILLFSCRTIVRNQVWKDSSTVFEALIRDHPESGRAQWLIGDFHFNRGDHAEGLLAYRRAIGMLGESYTLLSEVGRRLVFAGFDEPGERVLRRAWSKNPEFGLAPSILAVLYDRQGRWTLAEDASRAALAAEPGNLIQAHLLTRARTARQSH
ncbi:MAG: tetratricopeptide repeat protein [Gemmatimonadetes bacterium]|nr:tetratricopeptide repeat protein [Gemmatimonadota bacterium]